MASYTVAAAEIGAWEKTLVANTVDTVTFGRDCDKVRVVNVNGAGALYFTTDGSTPTVGASSTYWLPAVAGSARTDSVPGGGMTGVKILSAAATSYSVEGST
jgi:hypothetical protein